MMRFFGIALLLILVACSDDPTGPGPVASVDILWNQAGFSETTIQVGQTLELDAATLDAEGDLLEGRLVHWSSSAPQVASVDSAGTVSGLRVGLAVIVARSERAADTVRLSVIAPPSSALACEAPSASLQLRVGEVQTVQGDDALTLCVDGGSGSEYVYIPFNASEGGSVELEVRSAGVRMVAGPPDPALLPYTMRAPLFGQYPAEQRLSTDDHFHEKIRDKEDLLIGRIGRSEHAPSDPSTQLYGLAPSAVQVPALGDLLRINVNTEADHCTNWDYRTGRVEVVSDHAIIVADTANPVGGFTREEYRGIAETFDDLVHPVTTSTFGEPSDIDDNGRVVIFYTRAVNELTQPHSSSYVGGYYYGGDLKPSTGDQACEGSNEGEFFYMLVPDPEGEVNENQRSKAFVAEKTISVLAHEFQHLINFSRRVFVNDALVAEAIWLNEGLSHIAEELVFYEASGLTPHSNLASEEIEAAGASDAFFRFQVDNITRFIKFLQNPSNSSAMGADLLSTRGAAWSYLRYAADRHDQADGPFWFALANSTTSGVENLQNVLGADPLRWMQDWAISVYTDDAGLPTDPVYMQPSWNLRALIPAFRDVNNNRQYETYPLNVQHLMAGDVEYLSLDGGGAAFIRFAVLGGETAAIRMTHDGFSAPPYLTVSIVRTK